MLSFFAVRGIHPEHILSLSPLEKSFYHKSMDLYYKELNSILSLLVGGGKLG